MDQILYVCDWYHLSKHIPRVTHESLKMEYSCRKQVRWSYRSYNSIRWRNMSEVKSARHYPPPLFKHLIHSVPSIWPVYLISRIRIGPPMRRNFYSIYIQIHEVEFLEHIYQSRNCFWISFMIDSEKSQKISKNCQYVRKI